MQFESALRRYAVGLTRDPYRADDLVQETFIRAMGHLALLSGLQVPQRRAWFYRTLRNLFLDQERARQRQEVFVAQLIQQTEAMHNHLPLHIISEVLDIIPEHYRELLERRYLLGMTSQEIADELDIPAGTVRSRFRLIYKWLRKHRSEFI
ncbi:MAG: RNA polymerase sigma factor [Anaerolineae bacterium]|nr:RNA polymerase sigma factor [Anaerolineae bacterium]